MKSKSESLRKRLAGAKLIGFDTSKWREPGVRQAEADRSAERSKTVSTKAGIKCKIRN
jgi:hypothetical protein